MAVAIAVDEALNRAGFGDIRPLHANVFTFVPSDGIQMSELTLKAGVRRHSMAQALDELEKLDYIERRPHPSDKRARLIFLTARGKRYALWLWRRANASKRLGFSSLAKAISRHCARLSRSCSANCRVMVSRSDETRAPSSRRFTVPCEYQSSGQFFHRRKCAGVPQQAWCLGSGTARR